LDANPARARDRQAAAASQNEAEESDESEDEAAGGENDERGEWEDREDRGGMTVAARIGEKKGGEIGRCRRPRVGDG